MITIKRANINDATHIALLGRITYTESHGNYIENKKDLLDFYEKNYAVSQIQKEIKNEKNLFWIVLSDKLPIGFAMVSLDIKNPYANSKKSCKLQRLYILNDFIALKIGSQLQEIILKKITDLKFDTIWLTAYYKNTKGIKFYKKYGFKKVGNIDFYVGKTKYENLVFSKKI